MWTSLKNITICLMLISVVNVAAYRLHSRSGRRHLKRFSAGANDQVERKSVETTTAATSEQESAATESSYDFEEIEQDEEDTTEQYNEYPRSRFAYEVRDPNTGDDKQHEESREGGFVRGQYSLVEPDGSRRIVAYMSNGTEGFTAVVVRINASELTLPLESEVAENITESPRRQETESEQTFESDRIPNEARVYMDLEGLEPEYSEYKTNNAKQNQNQNQNIADNGKSVSEKMKVCS